MSRAHRILVVDDEASIRHVTVKLLTHAGYHVDAAEDGATAWNTLQANKYDLLITDNAMPNVSGVELIEKVRAAGLALPVVMVTAVPPEKELAVRPWLRPAAVVLKPYRLRDFLGAVQAVLERPSA